ncbi:MAG: ThuA domain-containing protein [Phycisphaeraceae bacterium JB051]
MNSDEKHIVLLAGKKSHGPEDNGIHDYPAQARLLHDCLLRSPLAEQIKVTRLENDDWQADVIDTADCLVVISDGRDGDLPYVEASHLLNDERKQQLKKRIAQGMGLVPVHFATFASEADMQDALDWQGAIFHWEQNGKRDWSSKITWASSLFDRMQQEHPILNGVGSPKLREEFYHQLTFHPDAVPLIQIRALPTQNNEPHEQAVAWCLDRKDGGRSFGTTMGHSLDIFRVDGLRTLVLNGIAWSAGLDIPEEGLQVAFAEREEVNHRVANGPAVKPIRVTMLSGNNAHRWHNWAETTGALLRVFGDDERIQTRVTTCPDDLVSDLQDCDVLVLNWVNWHDPAGLSDAVKQAIEDFTKRGGGVFVHHFANGACHASLPLTEGKSDWPWYRTLVQRVWEHRDIAPGRSHHDKFGTFEVRPQGRHPLTACLKPFEVTDELYWRQHGDEPIVEPFLVAKSNITGADEPLAWAYEVNESRVVQSLLGHSAASYEPPASQAFIRRVIAWCAKRPVHGSLADGTTE